MNGKTYVPTTAPVNDGKEADNDISTQAPTPDPSSPLPTYDVLVKVTVQGNPFFLNGVTGNYEVERGKTYLFDATDSSAVSGYHQFRVRQTGKYASLGGVKRIGDQRTGEKIFWTVGNGIVDDKCEFICRNHAVFKIKEAQEGGGGRDGGEGEGEMAEEKENDKLNSFDIYTLTMIGGADAVVFVIVGFVMYKLTCETNVKKRGGDIKMQFNGNNEFL